MSADVVTNPVIPYTASIPAGVFPSKTIYIQGFVPQECNRFSINLQSGVGTTQPDIAFHFNPRFEGQHYVVCNTKTGNRWGQEQRIHDNFPLGKGQNFEIMFLCEPHHFKVAVNGRHFMEYPHRMVNLQQITGICVEGHVNVYNIRYNPPSGAFQQQQPNHIVNPPCPYVGPIGTTGLQFGTTISVKVTIHPSPNRFHINLNGGAPNETAFHFNPRVSERIIVRNSRRGKWGQEERALGNFPFSPNGAHEVTIMCMKKGYRVEVDGHHVLEYAHRHGVETVRSLEVAGDVYIREINID